MPLAKVFSCAVLGLAGELVEVEVDVGRGKVTFQVVGLGDTAVQEARERVRSFASCTAASGSPTMANAGSPEEISTSTSTSAPSRPSTAQE